MKSTRRFGVEIEFCTNKSRVFWQTWLSSRTGLPVGTRQGAYSGWTLVYDGSVDGWELVSPILRGKEGLDQVRKMVSALKERGAMMDTSCGLHVHVDANDFTLPNLMNAVGRYERHEHTIDRAVSESRRDNRNGYATTMVGLTEEIAHEAKTKTALRRMVNYGEIERYSKLNICSYVKHGTLEFRQHEGTLDLRKMMNWVKFCVRFMDDVRSGNPFTAPTGTTVRQNSRIYGAVAKLFLKRNGHITKEEVAGTLGVSSNTVSSYMSLFRRKFASVPVQTDRGSYRINTPQALRSLRVSI